MQNAKPNTPKTRLIAIGFLIILAILGLVLVSCSSKKNTEPDPGIGITELPFETVYLNGIEWLVLDDVDGYKKLLLSKDILFIKGLMNRNSPPIIWEVCDMREYLNNEFYNSFSEADRAMILETENVNLDFDGVWYTPPTIEKIFLLSAQEVDKYLPISDFAKWWLGRVSTFEGMPTCWWTRTFHIREWVGYKLIPHHVGPTGMYDWDAPVGSNIRKIGIRPAMWVEFPRNYEVMEFGGIRWRVLEKKTHYPYNEVLVISESVLFMRDYTGPGLPGDPIPDRWEFSHIRGYLNFDFYNTFSAAEKAKILNTEVSNVFDKGAYHSRNTIDKIFLLNVQEINHYFEWNNHYDRRAYYNGERVKWWTRTHVDWFPRYVQYVDENGAGQDHGYKYESLHIWNGIRPAMRISLNP